jgi:hypothetical protein
MPSAAQGVGRTTQRRKEVCYKQLMRRVPAPLLALTPVEPASACHRFSRWYYPWPQRCNVDVVLPPASSAKAPQPEIPLPNLTPIGKGQDADEATRARLLLRATIEKDKN